MYYPIYNSFRYGGFPRRQGGGSTSPMDYNVDTWMQNTAPPMLVAPAPNRSGRRIGNMRNDFPAVSMPSDSRAPQTRGFTYHTGRPQVEQKIDERKIQADLAHKEWRKTATPEELEADDYRQMQLNNIRMYGNPVGATGRIQPTSSPIDYALMTPGNALGKGIGLGVDFLGEAMMGPSTNESDAALGIALGAIPFGRMLSRNVPTEGIADAFGRSVVPDDNLARHMAETQALNADDLAVQRAIDRSRGINRQRRVIVDPEQPNPPTTNQSNRGVDNDLEVDNSFDTYDNPFDNPDNYGFEPDNFLGPDLVDEGLVPGLRNRANRLRTQFENKMSEYSGGYEFDPENATFLPANTTKAWDAGRKVAKIEDKWLDPREAISNTYNKVKGPYNELKDFWKNPVSEVQSQVSTLPTRNPGATPPDRFDFQRLLNNEGKYLDMGDNIMGTTTHSWEGSGGKIAEQQFSHKLDPEVNMSFAYNHGTKTLKNASFFGRPVYKPDGQIDKAATLLRKRRTGQLFKDGFKRIPAGTTIAESNMTADSLPMYYKVVGSLNADHSKKGKMFTGKYTGRELTVRNGTEGRTQALMAKAQIALDEAYQKTIQTPDGKYKTYDGKSFETSSDAYKHLMKTVHRPLVEKAANPLRLAIENMKEHGVLDKNAPDVRITEEHNQIKAPLFEFKKHFKKGGYILPY